MGTVGLTCPDFDVSGLVDIVDIQQLAGHFGQQPGDPLWDHRYDWNMNGIIDVADLVIVGGLWETSCP